ncbi:MAG: Regulatory protein SoxS [Stenotrophomonas maltophilia]|uniref:Regulatory protein SoxS n=1 Tax=Stenotrophomonas maltophilia TaxID=40324 RepID=A0A7V8JL55_STEMA|nr:MAG: Regulatory protein SoxS [Stenotrophomonas maltophilia]
MKRLARLRQAQGIERVITHLQACLREQRTLPDVPALAAIAHQSPFHFQRLYRALTGESPGQTLDRLRLLAALQALQQPDAPISQAALAAGYESAQALARRCRQRLDATPRALREDAGLRRHWQQSLAEPPADLDSEHAAPLQVQVRAGQPFEVVLLRAQGAFGDLDASFGQLFEWAQAQGLADDLLQLVGIAIDDHRDVPAAVHRFDCGMGFGRALPALPAPLRGQALGQGPHAVVLHVGPYEQLQAVTDALLRDWWPGSGHALAEAPLYFHFLDDPEQVPAEQLRAEVCLPLAG